LVSDETDGFHQTSGGIPQQNPIDGIVDVGLDAGGVEEASLQIQCRSQSKLFGMQMSLLGELVNQGLKGGWIGPLRITLERTLGRHADSIDLTDPAEMLKEWTVGQTDSKTSEIFHEEGAHDIAAQSPTSMDLNLALSLGRDFLEFAPRLPLIKSRRDEVFFQPAVQEQLVHAQKLIAQASIVDIAFDGRERRLKGLLNGK